MKTTTFAAAIVACVLSASAAEARRAAPVGEAPTGCDANSGRCQVQTAPARAENRVSEPRGTRASARRPAAERVSEAGGTPDASPTPETHAGASYGDSRPSECYGIPWCGCWLRIQKGIADKGANRAAWWRSYGQRIAGPVVGAIAKFRWSHVGIVVGIASDGRPIIKSGNHNRRVATVTYRPSQIEQYRM